MDGDQELGNSQFQDDFDYDSIVLRRADPDDCDAIINLVEIGEDDIYNRVYSYPKILKLIETAYLAITAVDRDGNVVAFAAFEDFPQGMRGMIDDKHFNFWEDWFVRAYQIEEFSSFNTLWLTYFIAGGSINYQNQHHAFKQVLSTVYTSLPDLIGVLFLVRGDADEEDVRHCFHPLEQYFEQLQIKNSAVLQGIRGIHRDSQVFFSSRVHVLPFVEVRLAKQEDHDDLADVFNSQSETITEAYGEYFIAELIANQNENNKALVAQVKDKAIGLMGLTKEVDLKLLHKCFDLDSFDNLLKADYMDAIRARRDLLKAKMQREADNEQIAKMLKFKQETMRCNIVAQRMELQQHLLDRGEDIFQVITSFLENEEAAKELTKENVREKVFNQWIEGFEIYNPKDEYFLEMQTDDTELMCNIQEKFDFFLTTLQIFGLPKGYMTECEGHFADWGKQREEKAKGKSKKKGSKPAGGKNNLARIRQKVGIKDTDADAKPTHFDLAPVQKALKRFLACSAEVRSSLRIFMIENKELVRSIFTDEHGEHSFKRCVDVGEIAKKINEKGGKLGTALNDDLGTILLCFGLIEFDNEWGNRVPPENEEQKKARTNLQLMEEAEKLEEEKRAKEKDKKQHKTKDQEDKAAAEAELKRKTKEELIKKMAPKPPIMQRIRLTSIHDLLITLDRIAEYDRMLVDLKITHCDFLLEDEALKECGRPFVRELVPLPPLEEHRQYSKLPHLQRICEEIDDLVTIPDPPEQSKNAFAITLFCMEAAFDSRSKDILKYAFDLFPERDYLIVTQPHTVTENSLFQKFTLVPKKSENTFAHVLYLIHRDQLFEQDLVVTRSLASDLNGIQLLIDSAQESEETKTVISKFTDAIENLDSMWIAFTARVEGNVIASFLVSKDVNLDYYKSHFHIQDQILLDEHEAKSHARLVYSVINPIFERSTRFMLKELLRLSNKTCLYFEINDTTVIPTIFNELVHIRARRFPHFLDRKWDHERYDPKKEKTQFDQLEEEVQPVDGGNRDHLDEAEAPFALCFTSKRLLSEPKIVKNSRIVVVGASDTGISFVEALLSISYLHFTNITMIAPGGLPHHHVPEKNKNLKAYSTSYTTAELKKLMLESRIQVLDARMTDIDRSDKNIILDDGKVVPYDTLVLAMGIQDKTLDHLKYCSWGITNVTPGYKRCKGLLSIDDPYLYKSLNSDSSLLQALTDRRRQTNCVVYGRTLNTYCFIQGLLRRGVRPTSITLAIPRPECHCNEEFDIDEDMPTIYPDAFEDLDIESKLQQMLEQRGVTIVKEARLQEIITDRDREKEAKGSSEVNDEAAANLERVVFKRLDIPDEEEEEDEDDIDEKDQSEHDSNMGGMTGGEDSNMDMDDRSQLEMEGEVQEKRKKRKKNELEIECRVLVTCGHRDVDNDVFSSIHENGLVYNGRLIVDRNFQTTDGSIFAAGSLCEFSNRYKALSQGRSLRMDRYNGREMGSRLARSVFDIYDPQAPANKPDASQMNEELPLFYLPTGLGGVLPNDIIYYHIKTTNPMMLKPGDQEMKNRKDLICDNMDMVTGKGHYIKFTFNSIGLIDSVTYMGSEEIILQSLWSFVGLHENYLNKLTSRYDAGIIPNAVEFLSENWAIALYHEWFGDFCLRMRQGIQGLNDVQQLLSQAFEKTKHGQGLTREQIDHFCKNLDPKTVKMIEDETLEFIKTNMNHLPMYYIPGEEFP